MLLRSVIFAAIAASLASQIPAMIELVDQPNEKTATAEEIAKPQTAGFRPGRAILEADRRGHFEATFRINGRTIDGLVDTGASLVAINESTARRLGFGANSLDFRHRVNTANGGTEAAYVILDRVEIGSVRARQVEAFVLRDKALSGMLVGMSFLKKLKSFQVEGGKLNLIQ